MQYRVVTEDSLGEKLPYIPTGEIGDGGWETSRATTTTLFMRKGQRGRWIPMGVFHIPKGYKTDKASVPFFLKMFYSRSGNHSRGAIVHDFIYREGRLCAQYTRRMADSAFYYIMLSNKVRITKAFVFWLGVRSFGGLSFSTRLIV